LLRARLQGIDVEEKKWKIEFGDELDENITKWIRAAIPDYCVGKRRD
jgi:hypothetical protein